MRVRAVLLDVDGTLIDSNDAHAHAWVDALTEFGFHAAFDDVRWLIGMGGDRVLPRLTGLGEHDDVGARILERRGEIFRTRYLPQLRAFPGAGELLERLRREGKRLVIATSASAEDLQALLSQAGLDDLVDAATTADDADASKPAPDIVAAALERAGEAAAHAVLLGDTPYDVESARQCAVAVIALRCGGWTDEQLDGAREIYDDPRALLAAYDASLLSR